MWEKFWETVPPVLELALKDWGATWRLIIIAVVAAMILVLIRRVRRGPAR